jgi:uncharacterized RDD family membrane protein YckC
MRWTEQVAAPTLGGQQPAPGPGVMPSQFGRQAGRTELAGWWLRLGGYILDDIIVVVPTVVIVLLIAATQRTNTVPGTVGTHLDLGAQLAVVLVTVLILLGYPFLLLRYRGQTVGMMAVGVRAVDRASGATPTSAQAARRVLTFFVLVQLWAQVAVFIAFRHVLGPVPPAESVFRLVTFAALATTGLWPLGNSFRQTLQDKAAGTVVVRTR